MKFKEGCEAQQGQMVNGLRLPHGMEGRDGAVMVARARPTT